MYQSMNRAGPVCQLFCAQLHAHLGGRKCWQQFCLRVGLSYRMTANCSEELES
jgi:hypothetical protein